MAMQVAYIKGQFNSKIACGEAGLAEVVELLNCLEDQVNHPQ